MFHSMTGKWGFACSSLFTVLILLKVFQNIPVSTFLIAFIGIIGLVLGVISLFKKDYSIPVFFSIVMGGLIVGWMIGELWSPH